MAGKSTTWARTRVERGKVFADRGVVATLLGVEATMITRLCAAAKVDRQYDLGECRRIVWENMLEQEVRRAKASGAESIKARTLALRHQKLENEMRLSSRGLVEMRDAQAAMDKILAGLRIGLTKALANWASARFNLGRSGYDEILEHAEAAINLACDRWDAWREKGEAA